MCGWAYRRLFSVVDVIFRVSCHSLKPLHSSLELKKMALYGRYGTLLVMKQVARFSVRYIDDGWL